MARRLLTGLALTGVSLILAGAALAQTTGPGSSPGASGSGTGPTVPPPPPLQCSRAAGRRRPRGGRESDHPRSRPA